jgi:hypothetical protein
MGVETSWVETRPNDTAESYLLPSIMGWGGGSQQKPPSMNQEESSSDTKSANF